MLPPVSVVVFTGATSSTGHGTVSKWSMDAMLAIHDTQTLLKLPSTFKLAYLEVTRPNLFCAMQ